MFFNCEKITTFREVFDYISYDWDNGYSLTKSKDGIFNVNKLYIGPNYIQYKIDCHELADGLYDKVNQLYLLFNEENNKKELENINRSM